MSSGAPAEPLLEVARLRKHFDVSPPWLERQIERRPRQMLRAVEDVGFAIRRGATFGLVGESGSGKSTVAALITGLHSATAGSIRFDGVEIAGDVKARRRVQGRMQMIFQDPFASLNPRWRVGAIIAEPLQLRRQIAGRAAIRARVAEALRQVGLAESDARRFPHEFSGGQRQRISIARALAAAPEFLVCDEPTSALDVSVQAQILNLMRDLQRSLQLTYLLISHNLAVVYSMADAVGIMYLGRLMERGPTEAVFDSPLHPYTRMLRDAVPDMEMSGAARLPIGGEAPSPVSPPAGCVFHPRCPLANERCRKEVPILRERALGRAAACHAVEEGRTQA